MCPTCRQHYTGPDLLGLVRARDEQGSTPATKSNLATALKAIPWMGQFAEARRLYEAAVAGWTAQLGPAHVPSYRDSDDQGQPGDPADGHGGASGDAADVRGGGGGQTAQLGPAHADTLRTKGNLAALLMEMGEQVEARRLNEEVLAGQTVQLGPAHPDTLATKGNLAAPG